MRALYYAISIVLKAVAVAVFGLMAIGFGIRIIGEGFDPSEVAVLTVSTLMSPRLWFIMILVGVFCVPSLFRR